MNHENWCATVTSRVQTGSPILPNHSNESMPRLGRRRSHGRNRPELAVSAVDANDGLAPVQKVRLDGAQMTKLQVALRMTGLSDALRLRCSEKLSRLRQAATVFGLATTPSAVERPHGSAARNGPDWRLRPVPFR